MFGGLGARWTQWANPWAAKAANWAWKKRQSYRQAVPQWMRKAALYTPLGMTYQGLQKSGALRGAMGLATRTAQAAPRVRGARRRRSRGMGGATATGQVTRGTPSTGGYGYTAEATEPPPFDPTYFMGQWYHDVDPLRQAMLDYYQGQAAQRRQSAEGSYLANVEGLGEQRTEALEQFPKALERGLMGLQGYYADIAPGVYQSSQMVREKGLKERVATEKEKTLSSLERTLQQAESEWGDIQSGITDWYQQREQDVINKLQDFTGGGEITPPETPLFGYESPEITWDLAGSLGKVKDLYKTVPLRLRGHASMGRRVKGKLARKERSALEKYLYG